MRPKLPLLFALLLALAGVVRAQELQRETTPFTVWLDFHRLETPGSPPPALPIWMVGVTTQHQAELDGSSWTIVRLKLRPLGGFDQKRLLRLFFDDVPGASPTIVGRDVTGAQVFSRGPLGEGLNLPTSESLVFAPDGVDAIDIQVAGDGSNVRGAFLASLSAQTMLRALDFRAPGELLDAFGRSAPAQPPANDLTLYGRVRATLDTATVKLSPDGQSSVAWEFELKAPPLMALLDFETLNADGQAPLQITVNDQPLGAATVQLPDLADPGYVGFVRPLVQGMRFRYAGWLRAQVVIPGTALKSGTNRLVVQLHPDSGPGAVRAMELQLKHNWTNLDYTLTPAFR